MKNPWKKTGKRWSSWFLGTVLCLGTGAAVAAEPCPWESTEHSAVCAQWNELARRLEAAERRAETAEAQLESISDTAKEKTTTPVTPEIAQARNIIERFLDSLNPFPDMGGFEINRDYVLTQNGNTYLANFPEAAWVLAGRRVDFGPLRFEVQPTENSLSRITLRLGDTITVREDGKLLGQITIGGQDIHGVWDDSLESLNQATAELKQLKLILNEEPISAEVASLSASQTLEGRVADDTWSNRQTLELTGLNIEAEGNRLSASHATGWFNLDGRDYKKLLDLRRDFEKISKEDVEEAEAERRLLALLNGTYDLFTRFNSSLTITDVAIGKASESLATFDRIVMGGSFDEGKGSGSTLSYTMEMEGLQTPVPVLPPDLLPTALRLEIGFLDVPPQLLSRMTEIGLASEQIDDEEARDAYLNQQFIALFMTSNLGIYLKDTFIAAPAARVDLDLRSAFAAESPLGATGEFKLRIEGLQQMIDLSGATDQQEIAPILAMLTIFSNRTEENGKTVDAYDVRITQDGKIWLNGKDVTALFLPPQDEPQPPG